MTPSAAPLPATLAPIAGEKFVSLTTFRKSGEPVATPVWIAAHEDALVVTTPAQSGKVKRLRHTSRIEMRACSRSGRVEPGTPSISAAATIIAEPEPQARLSEPIRQKYGLEYRLVMGIEKVLRGGRSARVILRITEPDPQPIKGAH